MHFRHFYYQIKPFVPWKVRIAVRRWFAVRKRRRLVRVWPILPGSERPPPGWPGWPEGKKFGFVLTHDVEGPAGLERVRQLAELEISLGFRSAFGFVPEGEYEVTAELPAWLLRNGFGIFVHDLHHDGKLFKNRQSFRQDAARINHYLKDWGAVGFRSGFMLNELEWLHDLNVQYDASTFDTDPFEPQPQGVGTIFPCFIQRPEVGDSKFEVRSSKAEVGSQQSVLNAHALPRPGYVELPYTLPQDSTLFLLFREPTIDIWKRKLDWIAQHGGMALVNVHPDYLCFPGEQPRPRTFPAAMYEEFLEHVRSCYSGLYWHALPRQVSAYVRQSPMVAPGRGSGRRHRGVDDPRWHAKIWIDLENTPHIPFFKPIIRELQARGYTVVTTARDAYQTCELAAHYGLSHIRIGRHYGKRRLLKVWGLFARTLQLLPFVRRERPALAINHGSRTQTFVSNLMGIPVVQIMDYEHAAEFFLWRPTWEIAPSVVREEDLHARRPNGVLRYSGIKEDVYVPEFKPDPAILGQLGIRNGGLVVVVRPPATEAHYHNPESEVLFAHVMRRLCDTPGVCAVVLPRNHRQEAVIRAGWPQDLARAKVIIPAQVVQGLNLLWHSDLVVSGGGTMNREAAALGLPVYSIFRGPIGAVDRHLQAEGRLILIESVADVETKILLRPRTKEERAEFKPRKALGEIVDHIDTILREHLQERIPVAEQPALGR